MSQSIETKLAGYGAVVEGRAWTYGNGQVRQTGHSSISEKELGRGGTSQEKQLYKPCPSLKTIG